MFGKMRSRNKIITTANIHTDMIKRKKANPIWTIISLGFLGLCITACDSGELPGKEKAPANIELRFAASISDSPSTKTIQDPDIIQGTVFPDGTHTFGMFITDENDAPLEIGSADNMKLNLSRASGTDTWNYTDKNDTPLTLKANQGQTIKLTSYYPWTANATTTSVPFDLSGEVATWKDLLYLSSLAGTATVLDANPIALTFSHAYCWVTVKLSKLTDKNDVSVKSVSLENSYSTLQRIINKGSINPKTGAVNGTPGPLSISCGSVDIPLEGAVGIPALKFNFLVPPFMLTDIQDSDIVIRVTTVTSGVTEVLSFPLSKIHLNQADPDKYGFEKGKHNTYNIVYNNSEMVLSLSDWQETLINDSGLGGGSAGVTPNKADFVNNFLDPGVNSNKLAKGNHINHTYLGEVAENNNGKYVTVTLPASGNMFVKWTPFMKAEPFYSSLAVAKSLAAGGGEVPWKDKETGVLTAKQACSEFREGGYKDWRLPRVSEIYIITYPVNYVGGTSKVYWTATEYDATNCFATRIISEDGIPIFYPEKTSKEDAYYVRCVRDYYKPKPTI